MSTHRFRIHPSWVIVLAGVCAALHVGKLPPALPVLQEALGITLVQAGFLLSAVQVASMTLGLAVGLSADSLGLRRSMLVGLSLLSFASISGGFVAHASGLLCLRALEGLGFLLVVMPAPALIRRTVDASQLSGRMGWWGTYMPTGSALALLLGPWVIAGLNWSAWWWLLGAVAALAGVAVWLCVPDVPPPAPAQNAGNDAWPQRLALTLQSPGPWLVALTFAVYSSQWGRGGFFAHGLCRAGFVRRHSGRVVGLRGLGQCQWQHPVGPFAATRLACAAFADHWFCQHGLGRGRRVCRVAGRGLAHRAAFCQRGDVLGRGRLDSRYFVFMRLAFGPQRRHGVHHRGLYAATLGARPICRATAGGVGGRHGGWLAVDVGCDHHTQFGGRGVGALHWPRAAQERTP